MTFAQPEWFLFLLALPVIALTAWLAWLRRRSKWKALVADRLQNRLSQTQPTWTYFTSLALALIGLAGLIIAMAQPESGEEWVESKSEGRNILFCIDISRSMLTDDVKPSRLIAARGAALEILEKFPDDRVGILLFSGGTLVQSPLTVDHGFVEQTLSQLDPNDIPVGGSDLAKAIRQGSRLLLDTGQRNNIMVVFSDGEKSSPGVQEAAQNAAGAGVFIYALGFGEEGGFVPDPRQRDGKFRDREGRPVYSKLDEEALQLLASKTSGVYSRGMGAAFLDQLETALEKMDRFEEEGQNQRIAKPAHKWFLLLGLLFLMSSVIVRALPFRTATAAALIAVFFTLSPPAEASTEGRAALQAEEYQKASRLFSEAAEETSGTRAAQYHLAAGSAAFHDENWSSAIDAFSQALPVENPDLQHQAHYGLATSLYYLAASKEQKDQGAPLRGAAEHYQAALNLKPDDEASKENLAAIQKLLAEQQQQEQEQKPEESEDEKESEDSEEKQDKEQQSDSQENQDGESDDQKQQDQEDQKGEKSDDQENQDESQSGESDEESQEEQDQSSPDGQSQEEGEEQKDQSKQAQDQQSEAQKEEAEKNEAQQAQAAQQQPDEEKKEAQERARQLLQQFSDMGGKPPRKVKRPFRRPAQDW